MGTRSENSSERMPMWSEGLVPAGLRPYTLRSEDAVISKLRRALKEKKNRDLAMLAGGAATLMAGGKMSSLALFAGGLKGLEKRWRQDHPEFRGSLKDRFDVAVEFYDQTHQEPTNRILHTIGIPMILGGFVGMMASPRYSPPWWISNGSWTTGWALNFVGHGLFERGEPAFASDPLAPIAGPVWDFLRLRDLITGNAGEPDAPSPSAAPVARA